MAKGPEAFRTISEAAEELGVPQHVLRFWETRFSFIRPMKRAGGRRFYRPQDIDVLRAVQILLHQQGYTIKGVQRLHREQGLKRMLVSAEGREGLGDLDVTPIDLDAPAQTADLSDTDRERLNEALDGLLDAKARLDGLLKGR